MLCAGGICLSFSSDFTETALPKTLLRLYLHRISVWNVKQNSPGFNDEKTISNLPFLKDSCSCFKLQLLSQIGYLVLLMQIQIFEDGDVPNLCKDLALSPLAQLQTKSQEICLLQAHQTDSR
jgi:hypothetical protein